MNKIHRIRKPFFCKSGQFRENKQDLIFSISKNAIINKQKISENYECYIGSSNDVYSAEINTILDVGQDWTNRKGVECLIVPKFIFKKIKESK